RYTDFLGSFLTAGMTRRGIEFEPDRREPRGTRANGANDAPDYGGGTRGEREAVLNLSIIDPPILAGLPREKMDDSDRSMDNIGPTIPPKSSLLATQVADSRTFFLQLSGPWPERVSVALGGWEKCRPDYAVER